MLRRVPGCMGWGSCAKLVVVELSHGGPALLVPVQSEASTSEVQQAQIRCGMSLVGGASKPATVARVYDLCGPTYPGQLDASCQHYLVQYPGAMFLFPVAAGPGQNPGQEMLAVLPGGGLPMADRVCIFAGSAGERSFQQEGHSSVPAQPCLNQDRMQRMHEASEVERLAAGHLGLVAWLHPSVCRGWTSASLPASRAFELTHPCCELQAAQLPWLRSLCPTCPPEMWVASTLMPTWARALCSGAGTHPNAVSCSICSRITDAQRDMSVACKETGAVGDQVAALGHQGAMTMP